MEPSTWPVIQLSLVNGTKTPKYLFLTIYIIWYHASSRKALCTRNSSLPTPNLLGFSEQLHVGVAHPLKSDAVNQSWEWQFWSIHSDHAPPSFSVSKALNVSMGYDHRTLAGVFIKVTEWSMTVSLQQTDDKHEKKQGWGVRVQVNAFRVLGAKQKFRSLRFVNAARQNPGIIKQRNKHALE